jgi:hypothetical protein
MIASHVSGAAALDEGTSPRSITRILAVDPGPEESALVVYEVDDDGVMHVKHTILDHVIEPNRDLLSRLRSTSLPGILVIEKIESYGMAVGATVFETVFWSGRFAEAFPYRFDRIGRGEIKLRLCGSKRATDQNVRQALIDKYGPGKERAIGTKDAPGPLYKIVKHKWSALAVAVAYADRLSEGAR